MTNRSSLFIGKLGAISGLLAAAVALNGCDNGNNTAPTTTSPQTQQSSAQQYAPMPGKSAQIETLKASLFDDPENPMLLMALGDAYFESQRFQEAIPVYEKALEINARDVDTMNDLGLAYFYTGQPDAALAALKKATTTDPTYKFAWLSTGYILMSIGRYDEAVDPLNQARELDPTGTVGTEANNFLKKIEELKTLKAGQG